MTLDNERFRTINSTRDFLMTLMRRDVPFPKTKDLRERAYRLLKHYPEEEFVKSLEEIYDAAKIAGTR